MTTAPLLNPKSTVSSTISEFFSSAFKPLFLFGCLFSIGAIVIWGAFWQQWIELNPLGGWIGWHSHEMLFGFSGSIVVGFLLTASQNWTGMRTIYGWPLGILVIAWFLARIFWLFDIAPWFVTGLLDSTFYLMAAISLAMVLIKAGNRRNLFFVGILVLLSISAFYGAWATNNGPEHVHRSAMLGFWLISFIVLVMGGRVIPFFSEKRIGYDRIKLPSFFEPVTIVLYFISAITYSFISTDSIFTSILISLLGGLFVVKWFSWKPWLSIVEPMVWSLQLGYGFMSFGLLLWALLPLVFGAQVDFGSQLFHLITVGGLGGVIIAMVTRVSLAHTGRKVQKSNLGTFAVIAIAVTVIIRVLMPLIWPNLTVSFYVYASITWCIGFTLLAIKLTPLFFKKAS